jgi:hypothetical protein
VSLWNNDAAENRYGIGPTTKSCWTVGVKQLVDTGRWMDLRNACLYVDVPPGKSETVSPNEVVSNIHASYMICMGHEVVADLADAGIEEEIGQNPDPWLRFTSTVLERLQDFRKHYAESFKWSNLDLFADSGTH